MENDLIDRFVQEQKGELMDDLISRQDAISALCDKFKRTPTNAIRAMDAIKQLPPAQLERK